MKNKILVQVHGRSEAGGGMRNGRITALHGARRHDGPAGAMAGRPRLGPAGVGKAPSVSGRLRAPRMADDRAMLSRSAFSSFLQEVLRPGRVHRVDHQQPGWTSAGTLAHDADEHAFCRPCASLPGSASYLFSVLLPPQGSRPLLPANRREARFYRRFLVSAERLVEVGLGALPWGPAGTPSGPGSSPIALGPAAAGVQQPR